MTMRAIHVIAFGGPEVLVAWEVPDPVPGPGEVVADVAACDVIFLDTMLRRGWGVAQFPVRPPYVPGYAIAGRVAELGDGVDAAWSGRPVVVHTGDRAEGGGYVSRLAAASDVLTPVPEGVELTHAAALVHDGVTALALAGHAALRGGEWVLVTGASGGLGVLLVQLAVAAGARVIAAARGEHKLRRLAALGAELTVDYGDPAWPERVRDATGGGGADAVFDGVGGAIGQTAFALTADGGRLSAHGTPSGTFAEVDAAAARARGVTVRGIDQAQFAPADRRRMVTRTLAAAAAGGFHPVIGQAFPLERAAEAHAAIEARTVFGKTLLLP